MRAKKKARRRNLVGSAFAEYLLDNGGFYVETCSQLFKACANILLA